MTDEISVGILDEMSPGPPPDKRRLSRELLDMVAAVILAVADKSNHDPGDEHR